MLNIRLGLLLYLLLPNDYSWGLLSDRAKERVLRANYFHNTHRPDYADPECYDSGRGFDVDDERGATPRGRIIQRFLQKYEPKTVLEVRPGSGFCTR